MQIVRNNANREIIYPELSYEVVGAAFQVFNKLGWGYSEKQYQQALVKQLNTRGIRFEREVYVPLRYENENIGRYFADFVVEKKILLELKVVSKLGYTHVKHVLGYIRGANLKLGILLYFARDGVKYRRILNARL